MKKRDLEQWCSPTAHLFGFGLKEGGGDLSKVNSKESGFTYRYGIPPMYMSRTGKKAVRADVNGIGRMMSQAGFFNSAGGYYTFEPEVAEAINGYPYGAILRWKDPESGKIRSVRSLKADNKDDFVENSAFIDGVSWDFVDNGLPSGIRPRVFPLWDLRYEPGIGGTITFGDTFTADRPGMLLMQAGPDDNESVAAGDSEVIVWADVRMDGDEDFHSAGMLAYIPPVANAYAVNSTSSMFVDGDIESKTGYTAKYVAGYITLWLLPGDTVRISANSEFEFKSRIMFVPLVASDELSGNNVMPSGGGGSVEPTPTPTPTPSEPTILTVPHAMMVFPQSAMSSNMQLTDQTNHVVSVQTSLNSLTFVLPPRESNVAREFEVVVDVGNGVTPPQLTFLPANGESITVAPLNGDYSLFIPQEGVNVFKFREINTGSFLVSRSLSD